LVFYLLGDRVVNMVEQDQLWQASQIAGGGREGEDPAHAVVTTRLRLLGLPRSGVPAAGSLGRNADVDRIA
jgi:hypothetical protein